MFQIKQFNNHQMLRSFWLIGIASFGIRLFINFSYQLLIGNGGYYPLQVRTLLERGELAFPDMPFLFYLDATIVKLLSFFGMNISNELIITVVQLVDSISIPLLLIPLYQILKTLNRLNFSVTTVALAAYTVLSFHTLMLVSSSQKNALAITFLLFLISYLLQYLQSKKIRSLLLASFFFILVALTHFGTFSFTILLCLSFMLFRYKIKAIVPISIMLMVGLPIIYLYDKVRFERLIYAWKDLFAWPHPPQFVAAAIFMTIAIMSFKLYRKKKELFNQYEKAIILSMMALIFLIPLPFFNGHYILRFISFLFIPIALLLIYFSPYITRRFHKILTITLLLVTLASSTLLSLFPPMQELTKADMKDLNEMKKYIPAPKKSVVVSKHNLEFWVAWHLETSVSQESKFDKTLINDYEYIYIINQLGNRRMHMPPMPANTNQRNHFEEPIIPEGSVLVYESEYFKLYEFHKK